MLLGFCVASGTTLFARERSLDEVRDQAQRDVEFLARRAAENIESGLATAEEGVVTLAANPAFMSLFQPDVPEGCSLTFNSIGPFSAGRLDVVTADGRVVCSSGEVSGSGLPADTEWLSSSGPEPVVHGPIDDAELGEPSLVVVVPIGDVGLVAGFLGVESARSRLQEDLADAFDAEVALTADGAPVVGPPLEAAGGIAVEAEVPSLGWQVRAVMSEGVATSDIRAVHREVLMLLGAGVIVIVALIYGLYRSVTRSIERRSATVRAPVPGNVVAANG